ncbi:MAG: acetolactate synthase small subunit [Crocinitomicaceae bacterium]
MKETFNISVFTENRIGILNRITIIFTRRYLNIDSITASECELPGVYRYTIVLQTDEDQVKKVVGQIEKQVDVLKAFYHRDEDVVHQELSMFKLRTDDFLNLKNREKVLNDHKARVVTLEKDFIMIERTGTDEEIVKLFKELNKAGVLEFARSGRVAISKPMKSLEEYLVELEQSRF